MNLLSSYEMLKGIKSLHGAKPKTVITAGGALFLSEIEIGGDETLLVTLEFESEKQKVEVEYTVTFKILFWSISAKIRFVHTTFKSKAKVRVSLIRKFQWNVCVCIVGIINISKCINGGMEIRTHLVTSFSFGITKSTMSQLGNLPT